MEANETQETQIVIEELREETLTDAVAIWNQVVEDGAAFPQMELLDRESGREFFTQQSFTGVAREKKTGRIVGIYILHPNNVGRCGHICNASYAVKKDFRGHHIGEFLVRHSMAKGRELGFRILQFNAVVKSNARAMALYAKIGFTPLGVIPGGFLSKDGTFEDIVPHYIELL